MSDADFHKVRLLENSLWSKYLQGTVGGDLRHDSFIYHWRRIGDPNLDLGDYHALAKFRRMITGWWTISFYVLIILLIGIAGNLAATWMWASWFSSKTSQAAPPKPDSTCSGPGRALYNHQLSTQNIGNEGTIDARS